MEATGCVVVVVVVVLLLHKQLWCLDVTGVDKITETVASSSTNLQLPPVSLIIVVGSTSAVIPCPLPVLPPSPETPLSLLLSVWA